MSRVRSTVISDGTTTGAIVPCSMDVYSEPGDCIPRTTQTAFNSFHVRPSETITTTDEEHPDYRRRIAEGEIINSSFMRIHDKVVPCDVGPFEHHYKYVNNGTHLGHPYDKHYSIKGDYAPRGSNVPPFLSEAAVPVNPDALAALAVTDAFARMDTAEILALATAAEGRKTVESMVSIFLRLTRIVKALKKLDAKALRKEISQKELANRYMELRYAIRPLVYDVIGICKAVNKQREHVRKTSRGSRTGAGTIFDTVTNVPHSWLASADWDREASLTTSSRAGVLCTVNIDTISVFGVDQAVETLWELTPFSFIVDWFLNVGTTISAWTPNAGVTQLASWVTTKKKFEAVNRISAYHHAVGSGVSVVISGASLSTSYTHDVLTRQATPQLAVWPTTNIRFDGYKLTDIGIILSKLLK